MEEAGGDRCHEWKEGDGSAGYTGGGEFAFLFLPGWDGMSLVDPGRS